MASITKRGKKYSVIYTYEDSGKVKRQKWETFATKKEALARKAQVENEINNGTFIPPSSVTVRDLLKDFVELYGTKRWGLSAYAGNTALIENYINPIIGELNVQDINTRVVDAYVKEPRRSLRLGESRVLNFCPQPRLRKFARCCTVLFVRPFVGK